ncbi:hypothetical protein K2173_026664 [Erythroxylum novogranatense]|uniref:Uncharacterized protein n=1 Tax=Erythroxylum novogranatense TaxID=1862640 RepID=A0AAV8TWQ8_9ROSI|nr:hypothetical protein K2173_026664 [Erythroxylum novogranatense]
MDNYSSQIRKFQFESVVGPSTSVTRVVDQVMIGIDSKLEAIQNGKEYNLMVIDEVKKRPCDCSYVGPDLVELKGGSYSASSNVTSYSDHNPIKLFASVALPVKRIHRFKFENAWLLDNGFRDVVSDAWSRDRTIGVLDKITACSAALIAWQNSQDHNFKSRIASLKKRIDAARRANVEDMLVTLFIFLFLGRSKVSSKNSLTFQTLSDFHRLCRSPETVSAAPIYFILSSSPDAVWILQLRNGNSDVISMRHYHFCGLN